MPVTIATAEVAEQLRQLAAEQAGLEPADITLECHLQNDLNLDSLDQVEFAMGIEETFDITIPDEQAQQVRTVAHAVELVKRLLRQARPAQT